MTFSINEFYEKIKDFPWIDIEYPTHKYAIEVLREDLIYKEDRTHIALDRPSFKCSL